MSKQSQPRGGSGANPDKDAEDYPEIEIERIIKRKKDEESDNTRDINK
jgi:hypothetical protein